MKVKNNLMFCKNKKVRMKRKVREQQMQVLYKQMLTTRSRENIVMPTYSILWHNSYGASEAIQSHFLYILPVNPYLLTNMKEMLSKHQAFSSVNFSAAGFTFVAKMLPNEALQFINKCKKKMLTFPESVSKNLNSILRIVDLPAIEQIKRFATV